MDFEPANINLKISQGTDRWVEMRLVTPAVPADLIGGKWVSRATGLELTESELNPYDFTGKDYFGAMRKKHSSGTTSPITATNGLNFSSTANPPTARFGPRQGDFALFFGAEATRFLKANDYPLEQDTDGDPILMASKWVYDSEVKDRVTGLVSRLCYGQVVLTAEVTK